LERVECDWIRRVTLAKIYSLRSIILYTFYKNKNNRESMRNLHKCPTRTSTGFESTFQ
jgi:hypothetical protein